MNFLSFWRGFRHLVEEKCALMRPSAPNLRFSAENRSEATPSAFIGRSKRAKIGFVLFLALCFALAPAHAQEARMAVLRHRDRST